MKEISKVVLILISLFIITLFIPLSYTLLIPTPSIIILPNKTICLDGCGQLPMCSMEFFVFLFILAVVLTIVGIILYFIPINKKDKRDER